MAPQFKQLTDCPENLREAIDWLIQVRHGGDGRGLEKLPKALNKLIQDAINKARESIKQKKDMLDCSTNPSLGFTYCRQLDEQIKQAEEKIKTLSEGDKVQKEKLHAEINDIKTLKSDCIKSHYIDERRRYSLSQEIDEATDVIRKLEKFAKDLNNSKDDDDNNILVNLCYGFETFLGYKAGNYTGEGIVYGDCDRLRDSILMFMYGVLESVKEDENVASYYYISEKTLLKIKKFLYKGQIEFSHALLCVSSIIKEYDLALQRKTDEIKNGLTTLGTDLRYKHIKTINYRNSLAEQLKSWTTTIDGILAHVYSIKYNVDKLDPELRNRLKSEMMSIVGAVEAVKTTAGSDVLKDQAEKVDKELMDQEEKVTEEIEKKFERLRGEVEEEFGRVISELSTLGDVKDAQFKIVKAAVQVAKGHVGKLLNDDEQDGFEKKYKAKILENFETIKGTLLELDKEKTNTLHPSGHSKLHDDVKKISEQIKTQVESALAEVESLKNAVQSTANEGYQKVVELVDRATEALSGLGTKVQTDLENLKTEIDSPIENTINWLQKGVNGAASANIARYVIQQFFFALETKDNAPALHQWSSNMMGGGSLFNAIGSLGTYGGEFENFKLVLQGLSDKEHGNSFYEALIKDLQDKVKEKIQGVIKSVKNTKFNAIFPKFTMEIKKDDAGGDTVYNRIDQIKTVGEVSSLKSISFESDKLKDSINLFEKDPDTGDPKSKVKAAIDLVLQKVKKLEDVPGEVVQLKEATNSLLRQLKGDIVKLQEEINEIERNVNKATEELQKAISGVHRIVTSARKTTNEAVTAFTNELVQTSHNALEEVTKQVRKMFANGHRVDLEALKMLVAKQKSVIVLAVKNDLESGVKGFLRTMNKNKTLLTSIAEEKVLRDATMKFRSYYNNLWVYISSQLECLATNSRAVDVNTMFKQLVEKIISRKHFTYEVSRLIKSAAEAAEIYLPTNFGNLHNLLLQVMKQGVKGFTTELGRAYVNKYSGEAIKWIESQDVESKHTEPIFTEDATRCAKVMLTSISTLYERMYHLYYYCYKDWSQLKIEGSLRDENKDELKIYLEAEGFNVNLLNQDHSGKQVAEKLKVAFAGKGDFQSPPDFDNKHLVQYLYALRECNGSLSKLYWHVADYFKTCHLRIPDSPKYPCTIRDMLGWMCGLPYTRVYKIVREHCNALLKEKVHGTNKITNWDDEVIHKMLDTDLVHCLSLTSQYSYDVLVAIQGHGRGVDKADYPYACNFCDNSGNFYYPQSVPNLFDMLYDMVNRLCNSLHFLYSQCQYSASQSNGWADCSYGMYITSADWNCDKLKTETTDSKHNCPPMSQLQSFLADCCAGLLPHSLSSNGTMLTCLTCKSNQPGQTCLTPMGFCDIGYAASISGTGKDIGAVLSVLCRNADGILFKLYRFLYFLCPIPPKTLGNMYSFFCHLFRNWETIYSKYSDALTFNMHINTDTIPKCFPLPMLLHGNYMAVELTSAHLQVIGYEHQNTKHCAFDSISNISNEDCTAHNTKCASYLKSLCLDAHHTYPRKHSAVYLSWFVYSAWELWIYLDSLLGAFKNISCKAYGCVSCNCLNGNHGVSNADISEAGKPPNPGCHCSSIVTCEGVLPTLYKYGFTYGDTLRLNNDKNSKTCTDFVTQLSNVLNSEHFTKLFRSIDAFLFAIRMPFFYTLVALWLLSLLYLLHIMVVRLDLLHIKSHLHTPSSHRIAAQSLLAAARVGKLAKITYLQP